MFYKNVLVYKMNDYLKLSEINKILIIRSAPFGIINNIFERLKTKYSNAEFTILIQENCSNEINISNKILYKQNFFKFFELMKLIKFFKSYDLIILPLNNISGKKYKLLSLFILFFIKGNHKIAINIKEECFPARAICFSKIQNNLIYYKNTFIGFFVKILFSIILLNLTIKKKFKND